MKDSYATKLYPYKLYIPLLCNTTIWMSSVNLVKRNVINDQKCKLFQHILGLTMCKMNAFVTVMLFFQIIRIFAICIRNMRC